MLEHERIGRFFAPLTEGEPGAFALIDDAAMLTPPAGQSLIVTTDSVIEGVHIIPGATPVQIAQKLVRRTLSDLAAMGAKPWRYFLNLHTTASAPDDWFEAFAKTLGEEQKLFDMVLAGGDSTSGGHAIHVTLTCLGLLEGAPLKRSGARAGDDIYVSGRIGDAAHWLKTRDEAYAPRYFMPDPRIALGQALRGIATAAIDISDGLLADASRIAAASGVGLSIMRDAVPRGSNNWDTVLTGGDDYELCFAAPASARENIATLATSLALPLTRIGRVDEITGLRVFDTAGADVTPSKLGFEHS